MSLGSIVILVIGVWTPIVTSICCAADAFVNEEYGFSVTLPNTLTICNVDQNPSGISSFLDGSKDCGLSERRRRVAINASYNASQIGTVEEALHSWVDDLENDAANVLDFNPCELGIDNIDGHHATTMIARFPDGSIEVTVVASELENEASRSAQSHQAPLVFHTVDLVTDKVSFEGDTAVLKSIITTMKIRLPQVERDERN